MSQNKQEAKDSVKEAIKPGISRAPGNEQVDSETLPIIKITQEVESGQKENTANFVS